MSNPYLSGYDGQPGYTYAVRAVKDAVGPAAEICYFYESENNDTSVRVTEAKTAMNELKKIKNVDLLLTEALETRDLMSGLHAYRRIVKQLLDAATAQTDQIVKRAKQAVTRDAGL